MTRYQFRNHLEYRVVLLEFCCRKVYNAVNAPAQTMPKTPSTTYFVSLPVMSSVIVSIIFSTIAQLITTA